MKIDSQNVVDIFKSLEHNCSLKELDLSENSQLAKGDSEAVGCAIERMLNVNRTLKVLNLSGYGVTDTVVKGILTGLTKNTSLVTLNIGSPTLSGSCAVFLFQQMTTHPTLTLHVGEVNVLGVGRVKMDRGAMVWCVIHDLIPENCVEFFRALNNSSLKVSNLNVQDLTDQTADYFAVGLAESQSVQALKLSHSFWEKKIIGSAGAVSIFRSLEHNTSLEELDLSENNQLGDSDAVGCAIERMLNVNRTLKVLNLSGCNVTDSIVKCILTELAKNISLVTLVMSSPELSVTCAVSLFQQMTTHPTLSITVGKVNVLGVGRVKMDRGTMVWCVTGDLIPKNCVEFFTALNNSGLKVSNLNVQDLTDQTADYFAVGLAESQSVQALKLSHSFWEKKSISSNGAVSIFRSLEHNTTLEELDLSGNRQLGEGDSEAAGCAIERMLNVNRTLKLLKLAKCGFTSEVASSFSNGLAQNHSVSKMILHSNNIGSAGAVSIFRSLEHNTSLEELDLSQNRQLAEADSEAVGCAIERMLNVNRTLKVLNLSGCNVTDSILKCILTGLTKNTSLVKLDMELSKLSVTSAVSLFQQMTTLSRVHVGEVNVLGVGMIGMDSGTMWCVVGNLIPENCVEFFRALNNSGLKVSNLNVQDLTDQTADYFAVGLAESQSVQALKLSHSFWEKKIIGSAGAVSIFRSLEHNTTLEELDLSENSQLAEADSEAVGCAIERMLNVNTTLKLLNLSDCNVTDPIVKHILTGLMKNTSLVTLDIRSSKLSGSCAVSLFQQMTTHPTLSITVGKVNVLGVGRVKMDRGAMVWCVIHDLIPENCVEFFRALNNSGLKVSNLNVQYLTDQTADYFAVGLAESKSVEALKLKLIYSYWWGENISSAGVVSIFRSIEHNTTLEELDLSGNSQLAEGDSEAVGCVIERMLNVNRTLKVLNLSCCRLTNEVASHFANGLARNYSVRNVILHLNIIGSTGAVSIFTSLEHNASLEELDLSENRQIAERDSEAVGCAIERMLNVNRTLKVLNLSGCELDTTVITHIAAGLAHNASLAELNISDNIGAYYWPWSRNNITSEGCVHLFKALCNNTSLKKLDISHNTMEMEGSVALAEMLSCDKSLTELNLVGCDIPENGLTEILTRGLLHNTSLKNLDISYSTLGVEESVALAEMLSCNKSLTKLNLVGCDIPENGLTEILTRGLLHNTSLKNLDISYSTLGVEESVALAEMLSCNKSLTKLNLVGCDIPENGLTEILTRGLLHNTSLKNLDISYSTLGVEESVALAEMLSCNKTLTELNLRGCDIPEAGLREIDKGLLQNTTLTLLSPEEKTFLEAEIERLKKRGNFTHHSLSRLEIKTKYDWAW